MRSLPGGATAQDVTRLLARRQVQVNGNLCLDGTRRLKVGDVVRILAPSLSPPATNQRVKIRFCDAHLIVVEKPAGVTTQRHAEERGWSDQRRDKALTLEEMLPKALAAHLGWKTEAPPPVRRGPQLIRARPPKLPKVIAVHRLDRDTSGLMIFARTVEAEHLLINQFKKHAVERIYTAVCLGRVTEPRTIETHFVRDRGDGKRGSLPPGEMREDSQRAVTHIRPIESIGDKYSVIECRLETGRTHQIRIHLSEIGHALCGDKIYRSIDARGAPIIDRSNAPRQALHSGRLRFVHPITKETIDLGMGMPLELKHWLDRLRKDERH